MCPKNIKDYPVKTVLFIGLSSLGDNLLITPAIKLVRDTYKKAELDIVVGPRSVEFAAGNNWFARYFVFDRQKGFLPLLASLRKKKYDLVIDFRNSLLPFMVRARHRLTFFLKEFGSDKLYTHEGERMRRFLEPYFVADGETRLYFPLANGELEKRDKYLKSLGIKRSDVLIVLNPGASFPPKRWKVEKFAEAGGVLGRDYDAKIIIVGGKQETGLAEEIKNRINRPGVFNLAGRTTVRELAALLGAADLLITNDSGPMHLASAVQCPIVALFGPGNPYRYGPIGTKYQVVHAGMDCFPCRAEARCRKQFACMDAVTVEQVLKAARLILDEGKQLRLFDMDFNELEP